MPRHRKKAVGSLPPLLVRLIRAAGRDGRPDVAQALAAYGEYALVAVPTRGVLPRDTGALDAVVEEVARRRLGLSEARREFLHTIGAIEPLERRDAVQSAALAVELASDEACYCAGVAFGVTFAEFGQRR